MLTRLIFIQVLILTSPSSHAAFTPHKIHPSPRNIKTSSKSDLTPTPFPYTRQISSLTSLFNRRENDDYNNYYEDDEYDEYSPPPPRRRRPRIRRPIDDLSPPSDDDGTLGLPSPFGRTTGLRLPESVSNALLAGVFFLGIGTGVTVDSAINTNPKDLASRDAVDRNAPNPNICATYGASAMAFDQRVFVSFDPFNVYVAQADVKPACVLRPSNVVSVLERRGLINDKEVRSCKANMNTWAFVGDLADMPQLSCVYQSEDAQNEFLSNPKLGIGEDVYDDDREMMMKKSTGKMVKGGMTEGQTQQKVNAFGAN
mmetsp:Transcript_13958/g.17578  ORF Transcript_13958/g.17578 Transcript_13958/m.17578 type:complete len:313 (-) Transcript_13958:21-959(-)|eukprot:CAMPEP_0172504978 /NCGR_PEP_ID=MMETSP1066-20121228/182700_1 /TAXON_ID=671091 /ORGANISM="Coscinodiscus wailesii, Strain CCMP2513" /LENGTH=312 /DNA_ID=CAMNT_0013281399 /DNA_START=149 /DNA_END=1087 /DNA_ORIENTATION=+